MNARVNPDRATWLVILAAVLISLAVVAGAAEGDSPRIDPRLGAELSEMGNVLVLDVRSGEEVEETGKIDNAMNIEYTKTDALIEAIGEDNGRPVVLYCATGRRSGLAIEALGEAGYTGLVNAGGYEDLREALEEEPEEDG